MDKQTLVGYVMGINPDYANSIAKYFGLDADNLKTLQVTDEEVNEKAMELLSDFLDNNFDTKILLCSQIWRRYLDNTADKLFKSIMSDIGVFRSPLIELYTIRALYRYGQPVLDDKTYDALLKLYTMTFPETVPLTHQTYDEDIYPYVLKTILSGRGISNKLSGKLANVVDTMRSVKSTSVKPVEDYQAVYDFIMSSKNDILFSLKMDGVFVKTAYIDNKLFASISRGRASDGFDYSDAVKMCLPNEISGTEGTVYIYSEAFVPYTVLDEINKMHSYLYLKTPKSAAISLLRAPDNYSEQEIKSIKIIAHGGNGIGDTIFDKYQNLEKMGFDVPPNIKVPFSNIPQDFEAFRNWLKDSILDVLFNKGFELEIPSDGVVCEKIGLELTDRNDQYTDANIAIKFEQWKAKVYEATVKRLIFEQKRVNASVVIEIEPVVTSDNNTATRVNGCSIDTVVSNNIVPGSKIKFMRKSAAINTIVTE